MTVMLSSFRARLEKTERELAKEAIQASYGSIYNAAKLCGIHPYQMRRIINRHGLQHLLSTHTARGGNDAWRAMGVEA